MSPNTLARKKLMDELDAQARRATPLPRKGADNALVDHRRATLGEVGLTEAVVRGIHAAPAPADAPPEVRAALEQAMLATPDERAAALDVVFPPAPERVRGTFPLANDSTKEKP